MSFVAVQEESRRPANTPFKQQQLPSTQPTLSPTFVITSLCLFGLLFIILGAAVLVESDAIQSIEVEYSNSQRCAWSDRRYRPGWGCEPLLLNFTVTKTLPAPVFMYYKIEGFNQNNRRFVRSVSNTQLSGNTDYSAAEKNDCQPFKNPSDRVDFAASSGPQYANASARERSIPAARYHPCGLVPWSLFNDTAVLFRLNGNPAAPSDREMICDGGAFNDIGNPTNLENVGRCEKRGIAWSTVAGVIYNPVPNVDENPELLTTYGWRDACENLITNPSLSDELGDVNWLMYACNGWYVGEPGHQIPNPINEDLWVWNRIASYTTFKKMYRRITVDLTPGQYQLRVVQRWDVSSFGARKWFVVETAGWMGSKNFFLGALFIAAGCTCVAIAAAFLAKHWAQPPRLTS